MKILLIDPPYSPTETGGMKRNFSRVFNKIPSLGLAYCAAVLERTGHEVRIADCMFDFDEGQFVRETERSQPEVIGFTATTPVFGNAVRLASALRRVCPAALFVCGGAHATADPRDTLNSGVFDYAVVGEGEETICDLVSAWQRGGAQKASTVRGVAHARDGVYVAAIERERIPDLDRVPFPARHLLPPLARYRPTPASYRNLPLAVIMTSRGCPSGCVFCDRAVFGEELRCRSPENVLAEVDETVYKYGAREIRFFDDTFTLRGDRVEAICAGMRKLKPSVPWTCLTRVTAVNRSMLETMARSGCWQVLFGLESGDDGILAKLRKGTTVEQNRNAVLWAHEAGLSVRADFLVGTPWETPRTLARTLDFAKSLPIDMAHFNKFVPYPGTAIYRSLASAGRTVRFDNGSYINNHSQFAYVPEGLDVREYMSFLNRSYKEFYLRPSYIARKLVSLRSFAELRGHIDGLRSIISL